MSTRSLPVWAERYLERLRLSAQPPSYRYLADICRAHLSTFAFENISKLIYYRDQQQNGWQIPPIDVFVENAFRYDFGGTCFTSNSHLLLLLRALGFNGYLLKLGTGHMAIAIELPELPGERLYCDVGSASPFFEPMRFESDPDAAAIFGVDEIRMLPDAEQPECYRFTRYRRGELVSNEWIFNPDLRHEFPDYAEAIDKSNQPGAFFMKQLRCQIWQPDEGRNVSLLDNILTIRRLDCSQEQRTLTSVKEIAQVLADEFHLPELPVREAVDVLESLAVNIFFEKN